MRESRQPLPYDYKNKAKNTDNYIRGMLNRLQSMFIYSGLPETIEQRSLELNNMTHGATVWFNIPEEDIIQYEDSKHLDGGLYALVGNLGGVIDLNYNETYAVISHPRLKKSYTLKIGEDCVVMRNDSLTEGLLPILERYCTMIAENDVSVNLASIMTRATTLLTAGDDKTRSNAELYINKIFSGELSVIGELSSLEGFQGIKTQPYITTAGNQLTNLIELQQYLKAGLWNELGLNANYNMKRESLNTEESMLNHDALLPLVDDMLHCREVAVNEINSMFGTEIKVELHSAWKDVQDVHELQDSDGDGELDDLSEETGETNSNMSDIEISLEEPENDAESKLEKIEEIIEENEEAEDGE